MSRGRAKRNKFRSLYIWHRYAGIFAALFVIILSVTGIALNHTDDLALKNSNISASFLLDHYNVQQPSHITRFIQPPFTVTQADDVLFVNGSRVASLNKTVIGIATFQDFILVATEDEVRLINDEHIVVETLGPADFIPNNLTGIANYNNEIYLQTSEQTFRLTGDLTIEPAAQSSIPKWSSPTELTEQEKKSVIQRYKSNIISLETVLLDLHSGRIFGHYGVLLFDAVGLILIFLAGTGIIIWLKQRHPKKHWWQRNRNWFFTTNYYANMA